MALKSNNCLTLLSLDNLRDLSTVEEYKRLATQQPYTLLCFMGHDGHSLHIVCQYTIAAPVPEGNHKAQNCMLNAQSLTNAFRKLHFIYSSQLGTPLAEHEPASSYPSS